MFVVQKYSTIPNDAMPMYEEDLQERSLWSDDMKCDAHPPIIQ